MLLLRHEKRPGAASQFALGAGVVEIRSRLAASFRRNPPDKRQKIFMEYGRPRALEISVRGGNACAQNESQCGGYRRLQDIQVRRRDLMRRPFGC